MIREDVKVFFVLVFCWLGCKGKMGRCGREKEGGNILILRLFLGDFLDFILFLISTYYNAYFLS